MMSKNRPRNGKNAEKPGSYEQAFRVNTSVINPGDVFEVELYLTGYGEIKSAKIVSFQAPDVFDREAAYILHGFNIDENGKYSLGNQKNLSKKVGSTIVLSGLKHDDWEEHTLFFDVDHERYEFQILTETNQNDAAPFTYNLATRKNVKPGTYSLEFHFTYFNGEAWKTSSSKIEFKVRNFFERNNTLIGWLTITATISAIIRFAAWPIVKYLAALW